MITYGWFKDLLLQTCARWSGFKSVCRRCWRWLPSEGRLLLMVVQWRISARIAIPPVWRPAEAGLEQRASGRSSSSGKTPLRGYWDWSPKVIVRMRPGRRAVARRVEVFSGRVYGIVVDALDHPLLFVHCHLHQSDRFLYWEDDFLTKTFIRFFRVMTTHRGQFWEVLVCSGAIRMIFFNNFTTSIILIR